MTRSPALSLILGAAALLVTTTGCQPDDVADDTGFATGGGSGGGDEGGEDGGSGDGGSSGSGDEGGSGGDAAIVGAWLSEGEDISPLFRTVYFDYVEITADFDASGAYEVNATDDNGATYQFTGSYVVDTTTEPASIVLSQATPDVATAEGIWQVEGSALTYEVVQTNPSDGTCSPPTPEAGFGSTDCGSLLDEGDNVQIYRAD